MGRIAEFVARIRGEDDASKVFDHVAAQGDRLESDPVEVEVKGKGLEDFTDQLGALPGPIGDIASGLSGFGGSLAAAAGPAAGVATALLAAGDAAADTALSAATMADLTGSTVEDASRLQNVWKQSGADVNDLNDVMLQMNGVLRDSPEVARQLGVNLDDGKDIAARFVEVVDKIQHSTLNAADKAALMSKAFGEEGVRQVQALATLIGGDLQDAVDAVSDSQVISDDDVTKAREYKQNMAELKSAMSGVALVIGQAVVPAVTNLAEGLNSLPVDKLAQFVDLASKATPLTGISDAGKLGDVARKLDEANKSGSSWADTINNVGKASQAAARFQDDVNDATDVGARIADAAGRAYAKYGEQVRAHAKAQADAVEHAADMLNDQADALNDTVDAFHDYADASLDAEDAQVDLAAAIRDSADAQKKGDPAEITRAVRDERDALIKAADAHTVHAEKMAISQGQTFTATQKLDTFNDSLLANANYATPAARAAIADYIIEVNGIPDEQATEIRAAINRGDLAEADRLLDNVSKARDATINADAATSAAAASINAVANANYTATITVKAATGGAAAALRGISSLANKTVAVPIPSTTRLSGSRP